MSGIRSYHQALGTVSHDVTIALPTTAADVAALQREAESDLPAVRAITVASAEDYTFADAILTDIVRRKDAVVSMRKQATVPLYGVIRTIESWFKPVVVALEQGEAHLKRGMGAWRLEQANAERAAREAAATAAESGDAGAMLGALNAAAAAQSAPAESRATVRYVWAVKRIAEDLLPREWFVPDVARLEKLARETPGDADAPVVPGVVFERRAIVGAKR